ncbi:MAG: hypothetical protein HRF43_11695 [Phycisphaerae bacterium]
MTAPAGIEWKRHDASRLFDQVIVDGRPLVNPEEKAGLLDGCCRLIADGRPGPETLLGPAAPRAVVGPVRAALSHRLLPSAGGAGPDLLEAVLTLQNTSDAPHEVWAGFLTGARPCADPADQRVYVPLSASALGDKPDDPRGRLKDCRQVVGREGFLAHYLEPQASDLREAPSRAALLAPVVDVFADGGPGRLAFIGPSTQPLLFEALQGPSGRAWRFGRRLSLGPGESKTVSAYLLPHRGDAAEAWSVFHRVAHREEHPPVEWLREVRVHYYDFLSPAVPDGPRGLGYDLDLKHFNEFHVGLATQHGYYASCGDFVHPDRKEWQAMPTDPAGPVTMSIEKVRARVEATRKAGVHPAIYMHYAIIDEGSPLFEQMRDSILTDAAGRPVPFGWKGPDTITQTWRMSQNAPQWRDHLVQQAQWIMELFKPDAIVLDETFTAWGYDHHRDRRGPLSAGGIELMRKLRAVVRSFGPDKALLASDCSMANFCLWGDGEAGDHCYDRLLGHELYRLPPVRYLAALGRKPWLPCAWLYHSLWSAQMDLARKTGAAVGVSNGWGDGFGLTRLPAEAKKRMLADIEALASG